MWAFALRQGPRLPLALLFFVLAVLALAAANLYLSSRVGDWDHFYYAARAVAEGENPFESNRRGYIYPATLAFLLQPLATLPFEVAGALWVVGMAALVAATVWLGYGVLAALTADRLLAAWVTCGVFLLIVEKMYSTLKNAQTDAIILFALVASLAWVRRYPTAAGLAVAFAAAIKYHAFLLLFVFLIRRDFKAAAATVIGFAALLLLPALGVGWDENLRWIAQGLGGLVAMVQDVPMDRSGAAPLAAAAVAPISWERSVSLPSAFSRLAEIVPGLPPLLAAAGLAAVCGYCVGFVINAYRRVGLSPFWSPTSMRRPEPELRLIDWSLVVVIILVFSPQTTGRHYMLAFLPLLLLGLTALRDWARDRDRTMLLLMGAVLLALYLPPSDLAAALAAWKAVGGLSWVFLAAALFTVRRALARLPEAAPSDDSPGPRTAA